MGRTNYAETFRGFRSYHHRHILASLTSCRLLEAGEQAASQFVKGYIRESPPSPAHGPALRCVRVKMDQSAIGAL